jgi:hypothetical protein
MSASSVRYIKRVCKKREQPMRTETITKTFYNIHEVREIFPECFKAIHNNWVLQQKAAHEHNLFLSIQYDELKLDKIGFPKYPRVYHSGMHCSVWANHRVAKLMNRADYNDAIISAFDTVMSICPPKTEVRFDDYCSFHPGRLEFTKINGERVGKDYIPTEQETQILNQIHTFIKECVKFYDEHFKAKRDAVMAVFEATLTEERFTQQVEAFCKPEFSDKFCSSNGKEDYQTWFFLQDAKGSAPTTTNVQLTVNERYVGTNLW